jgi:fumarate hydratase, class I
MPQIDSKPARAYAGSMSEIQFSVLELIRRTSAEIPDDVNQSILASLEQEKKGTIAESALKIIDQNIQLARRKSQPICQDTGSILFYVDCPVGFDQIAFEEEAREAVKLTTKKGYLRQNSVDSLTGVNDGTNCGPGAPTFHFHQHRGTELNVRLVLKGGGCENVGAQYSLPNEKLNANRDLDGCRKAILDAVLQAQGKGCGPGILGVCIGGDRATGYEMSKTQFLRRIPDRNPNPDLDKLEQDILKTANELGIGPMGFGGKTTLLGVKICAANRLPASYFVSISYMCWAYRRQGVTLDGKGTIIKWLY